MKTLLILLALSIAPTVTYHDYAVHAVLVSKHDGSAVIATEFGTYAFPVSAGRFVNREVGEYVVVDVRRGWLFGHRVLNAD